MNGMHPYLVGIFVNWFPMLLLIGVWIFFVRKYQGGGGAGPWGYQKRTAEALERIAAALEKRPF